MRGEPREADAAPPPMRVEVLRGGLVESVHEVDLVVLDGEGEAVLTAGRPERPVFVRSAVKPLQALPLIEDGVAERLGLTSEELALCCASHSGEERHVAVARRILERLGVGEEALACGPHEPFSSSAARALRDEGRSPGRLHNNCSGKHAGMLALARGHDWPLEGYHEPDHPVQRRILEEITRWTAVEPVAVETGVDGCGVPTFRLPLTGLALALSRLASSGGAVVSAMTEHPFLVAGSKRLCTELMEATGGRVLAKVGAEGVYGAAELDRGWGIALKARDGARRAAETALMAVLQTLDCLRGEEALRLERWIRRSIENTRGERVGEIRAGPEEDHGG